MKTITFLLYTCFLNTMVNAKAFANDPDVPRGQPEWSEWQLTTVLPMNGNYDIVKQPSYKLENVYYYYSEVWGSCSEPAEAPCTSEMYFVGLPELKYVPYYMWNTFQNNGTKNNPVWILKTWFNFNNTNTHLIESSVCDDGIYKQTKPVYPTTSLNFSLTFNYTCKYDVSSGRIAFKSNQKTFVNKKLKSDFTLFIFTGWKPYTNIIKYEYNVEPLLRVQDAAPIDTECKFC